MRKFGIFIIVECILFVAMLALPIQGYAAGKRDDIQFITQENYYHLRDLVLLGEQTLPGVSRNDREIFTLPLKRAGNLILLEAIIDGVSGNLILDTGSAALVLNSIYFRGNRREGQSMAGGITGSTGPVSRAQIDQMQLFGMVFQSLTANLLDLGHIEQARNTRVLGFFGLSLFQDYEVVLDLQRAAMELHPLNSRGYRVNRQNNTLRFDIEIPATVVSNVLFIDAIINNRKLTFCLDTGAESNVLSSSLPDRVLRTIDVFRRSNLHGAGAQQREVVYGAMNDFKIGNLQINDMNIIITNLNHMSGFFGIAIDGMLGCDFLEKGIFSLNLKRKMVGIVFHTKNDE